MKDEKTNFSMQKIKAIITFLGVAILCVLIYALLLFFVNRSSFFVVEIGYLISFLLGVVMTIITINFLMKYNEILSIETIKLELQKVNLKASLDRIKLENTIELEILNFQKRHTLEVNLEMIERLSQAQKEVTYKVIEEWRRHELEKLESGDIDLNLSEINIRKPLIRFVDN